jgi:hypothetical protein
MAGRGCFAIIADKEILASWPAVSTKCMATISTRMAKVAAFLTMFATKILGRTVAPELTSVLAEYREENATMAACRWWLIATRRQY